MNINKQRNRIYALSTLLAASILALETVQAQDTEGTIAYETLTYINPVNFQQGDLNLTSNKLLSMDLEPKLSSQLKNMVVDEKKEESISTKQTVKSENQFRDLVMQLHPLNKTGLEVSGDVNDDGTLDYIRADTKTGVVRIEDGYGNEYGVIDTGKPVQGLAVSDVNGDGLTDVVVMNEGTFQVQIYDEYGNLIDSPDGLSTKVTAEYYEVAVQRALDFLWKQPAGEDYGTGVSEDFGLNGSERTCLNRQADITWQGIIDDYGRNVIHGTTASEVIIGTNSDDLIVGFGGDDTICGFDGDDWIYGDDFEFDDSGGGYDVIDGGHGDDKIIGGGGDSDFLYGSYGDDALFGGWGNDFLVGYHGVDFLVGMWGDDVHSGGGGNDVINAFTFDDSFFDSAYGGGGYDHCYMNAFEIDLANCEESILN